MRIKDILSPSFERDRWEGKGYAFPKFDIAAVREKTRSNPTWIHFGCGNIFRAFPAAVLQKLLDSGEYDRGVIVAESFDYEIVEKALIPYDNLSLLVVLKADGNVEKKIIASITESLRADYSFGDDWKRLEEIFAAPSLQMASFTITEKGYTVPPADLERKLTPAMAMGKVAALLFVRFMAGAYPITLQSMDNCAHNGDVIKQAVLNYGRAWVDAKVAPAEFLAYLQDETKVSYPLSMIDKITPHPSADVKALLVADAFGDSDIIVTGKGTHTGAFINAEETEYLVIEDKYTAGRPPLEKAGVIFTERETVDKVEKMKVCTCLNPLHTAMAIFGCLLGYTRISQEMKDADIVGLITNMGHKEAMPVVVNPGVLNPREFIDTVIEKRLPNPFMPDAPQRIASDTSQKLSIRFGETIKAYVRQGLNLNELVLIPLTLAGYARYLRGLDDEGKTFTLSPDPKLDELSGIVSGLELEAGQDFSCLRSLYSREDIFGVDLYKVGLGERIESMAGELFEGKGAVRKTLNKYVRAVEGR